ncbi:MAG: vanadium-dependent haloperoxidase [Armatimonadetes bacterium]|nr:vanadium-dependent haloperoxidase [Armatimonadota bacterium]
MKSVRNSWGSNDRYSRRQVLETGAKGTLALGMLPFMASLAGCGGSGVTGSGGSSGTRSLSYQWTGTLLETISAVRPGPPMTARAIGMVATAIFDAWANYDSIAVGTRLGSRLRRPTVEHTLENKNKAISFAAYRVLVDLYPARTTQLTQTMTDLGYNPSDTSTDTSTPEGIGNTVAAALLQFRHQDGSNQLNNYADTTGYVPVNTVDTVNDPSQWQPLRFANGASPGYIAPHWGNVVPFALSSPSVIRPTAPPAFGSPTYLDQAQEVIDVLSRLNDRTKVIAEYWADGPGSVLPPGHWQLFGRFVSERDDHTLDDDVKMFFLLGNAVFDAGIACWDCKRAYNSSRPITAIRNLFAGQQVASFAGPNLGVQMVDGSQWMPYQSVNFVTPPFPEFTSGHSTFSSAGAEILKRFTGSDSFGFTIDIASGWSGFETGVPAEPVNLSYSTFSAAADDAGISRVYGGIHFRAANIEGQRCGRLVGEMVWNVGMSYINGTAGDRVA